MRLHYTETSRGDVAWWRYYYRRKFPQGRGTAYKHLATCERSLKDNPQLGHEIAGRDLRKLSIPHTPFAIVYRIRGETIEIVRLYDMRQRGSQGFQED